MANVGKDARNRVVKNIFIFASIILLILGIFVVVDLYEDHNKDRVKESITIEAGYDMVELEEYLLDDNDVGKYIATPSEDEIITPGSYPVEIEVEKKIGSRTFESVLNVVDTTPPTAVTKNLSILMPDEVKAEDFIKSVDDISEVNVYFEVEPDYTKAGDQEISIKLEDEFNNMSLVKSNLNITFDTTPPLIEGTNNKTVYVGDTISYRKDVTVTDDIDEEVKLEIDNSQVNLNKAGVYPAIYSATDSRGNTATVEIKVTVNEKVVKTSTQTNTSTEKYASAEEDVNAIADKILKKITNSSMSQKDKAWAIYKWVKNNLSYTGSAEKTVWVLGAKTGFNTRRGDCFTYFAVTKALLTRAEIPNLDVSRVGGKTNHYWHLVDVGQGWYHYDTCPQRDYLQVFLLTDAEVEAYTKRSNRNYYTFDKSKYPERGQ